MYNYQLQPVTRYEKVAKMQAFYVIGILQILLTGTLRGNTIKGEQENIRNK